jgi:hypothetical protein
MSADKRKSGFDIMTIVVSMIPLFLGSLWWFVESINNTQKDIQSLRSNMMMLVDPNGQIIPSPNNAISRQKLREDLMSYIHDMQVRLKLLEAHVQELKVTEREYQQEKAQKANERINTR